jgi:hypothetical protein
MSKVKKLEEQLKSDMDKYCDLVWYARTDEQELLRLEIYEGLKKVQEIEKKYPEEISNLINPNNDNWDHGFNSGMLAASRMYIEILTGSYKYAIENFPELDS